MDVISYLFHSIENPLCRHASNTVTATAFDKFRLRWPVELIGIGIKWNLPPISPLANKLVRICYATLRDKQKFDETQPLASKLNRQAFTMPV